MTYTAIVNLVSEENVIVENLIAINKIVAADKPIEVFISKDFKDFQLSKALKYVFIGTSEIALPHEEIINVKLILNSQS